MNNQQIEDLVRRAHSAARLEDKDKAILCLEMAVDALADEAYERLEGNRSCLSAIIRTIQEMRE